MYAVNRIAESPGATGKVRSLGERARAHARTGNERGQSLIELALTLPILLLLMTGMFKFGIAYNTYLKLTDAVAAGGRNLAISRGNTTDPCGQTYAVYGVGPAVYKAAPSLTQANLKFWITLNGTNVANGVANPTCSGTATSGGPSYLVQGTPATVVVQYPCDFAVFGVNYSPTCKLTAVTTEIIQ